MGIDGILVPINVDLKGYQRRFYEDDSCADFSAEVARYGSEGIFITPGPRVYEEMCCWRIEPDQRHKILDSLCLVLRRERRKNL